MGQHEENTPAGASNPNIMHAISEELLTALIRRELNSFARKKQLMTRKMVKQEVDKSVDAMEQRLVSHIDGRLEELEKFFVDAKGSFATLQDLNQRLKNQYGSLMKEATEKIEKYNAKIEEKMVQLEQITARQTELAHQKANDALQRALAAQTVCTEAKNATDQVNRDMPVLHDKVSTFENRMRAAA